MKNWKTTLAGIITNTAYLILTAMQTGGIKPKDIVLTIGIQTLATLAKDFNVTGK